MQLQPLQGGQLVVLVVDVVGVLLLLEHGALVGGRHARPDNDAHHDRRCPMPNVKGELRERGASQRAHIDCHRCIKIAARANATSRRPTNPTQQLNGLIFTVRTEVIHAHNLTVQRKIAKKKKMQSNEAKMSLRVIVFDYIYVVNK